MKKSLLSLTLMVWSLLFLSCQKEEQTIPQTTNQDLVLSDLKVCTELHDESLSRAFGYTNNFWNKEVLTVKFLGGTDYVQSKVRQYANQWSQYADIKFEFVESGNADIRISFDRNEGSWSYVGRSNQYVSQNSATMNFGWFTDRTSDREFSRTTLHEFGHALGLLHEHQHPQSNIDWNFTTLYDYYERTQGWSESDVDNNIVEKYSLSRTNYSDYDPKSIMHYTIPRELVNGPWTEYHNTTLSETDRAFINSVYPFESGEVGNSGDNDDTNESTNANCNCPSYTTTIACDNFNDQQSGAFDLGDFWQRWDAHAGAGIVGQLGGSPALNIDYSTSANPDIVFMPSILSEGDISMQWDLVVSRNSSAYFNIQKQTTPGAEHGLECFFYDDRTGRMTIGTQTIRFRYPQSRLLTVKLDMDFANDQMTLLINGQTIMNFPISMNHDGSTGSMQVAGIDFYASDSNANFWLDNFCVGGTSSSNIGGPLQTSNASIVIDSKLLGKPQRESIK